jgi:hypothetical protein
LSEGDFISASFNIVEVPQFFISQVRVGSFRQQVW